MCGVGNYCNDGYCTALPSCVTELNQVKEVSNRCICSDLAATHPVICEANHYCFRFEHADIDMSDIGAPVMVAPLTLGSSNGHARCLEKPFCESVDGSAKKHI